MKVTDFLIEVGRPVAYYPSLVAVAGSATATILLCQFLYWRDKEHDPNGWLFKKSFEIKKETGLSYNEQVTARKYLRERKLMKEKRRRLHHDIGYLLDLDEINKQWERVLEAKKQDLDLI